jgi:hypothetical protein
MGFFSSKREENLDIEDSVKILATNLEVINQRLASLSGGGLNGDSPEIHNKINDLSKKIDFLTNLITSSNNKIHQEISMMSVGLDTTIQTSLSLEDKLIKNINYSNENLRKQIFNLTIENFEKTRTENIKMINSFENNNLFIADLKDTFKDLAHLLPELMKEIPLKLEELNSKIEEMEVKSYVKEEGQVSIENIQKTLSKNNKPLEIDNNNNLVFSNTVIRDIKIIKSELQGRFFELTKSMASLMKINKDLVYLLKEDEKD